MGERLVPSAAFIATGKVVAASVFAVVALACVIVVNRIVREVKRGKPYVIGLYLSIRQANRRITQLSLVVYITAVLPIFTFLSREVMQRHALLLTIYLITVVLAALWLGVMSLFDLRELRKTAGELRDETARGLADRLRKGSGNGKDA